MRQAVSSVQAVLPSARWLEALSGVLACALLVHGAAAVAQAFPTKPVRFLSGQPPGGGFARK